MMSFVFAGPVSSLVALLVNVVAIAVPVVGIHIHVAVTLAGIESILIAGLISALILTLVLDRSARQSRSPGRGLRERCCIPADSPVDKSLSAGCASRPYLGSWDDCSAPRHAVLITGLIRALIQLALCLSVSKYRAERKWRDRRAVQNARFLNCFTIDGFSCPIANCRTWLEGISAGSVASRQHAKAILPGKPYRAGLPETQNAGFAAVPGK